MSTFDGLGDIQDPAKAILVLRHICVNLHSSSETFASISSSTERPGLLNDIDSPSCTPRLTMTNNLLDLSAVPLVVGKILMVHLSDLSGPIIAYLTSRQTPTPSCLDPLSSDNSDTSSTTHVRSVEVTDCALALPSTARSTIGAVQIPNTTGCFLRLSHLRL
jgi:hypothetical protein